MCVESEREYELAMDNIICKGLDWVDWDVRVSDFLGCIGRDTGEGVLGVYFVIYFLVFWGSFLIPPSLSLFYCVERRSSETLLVGMDGWASDRRGGGGM